MVLYIFSHRYIQSQKILEELKKLKSKLLLPNLNVLCFFFFHEFITIIYILPVSIHDSQKKKNSITLKYLLLHSNKKLHLNLGL